MIVFFGVIFFLTKKIDCVKAISYHVTVRCKKRAHPTQPYIFFRQDYCQCCHHYGHISYQTAYQWGNQMHKCRNCFSQKIMVSNCRYLFSSPSFEKKLKALAATVYAWRPYEVSGPLNFFNFSFINFEADFFRGPKIQSFETRDNSFCMGGPDI